MPSEEMRAKAIEWWTNPEYPDECPTEHDVDTLAALLDEVRREGFAGGLEEAAKIVAAHCHEPCKYCGSHARGALRRLEEGDTTMTTTEKLALLDLTCGHIPMTSPRYAPARAAVLALAELLQS